MRSRVPLAGHAQAGAITRSRRNPELHGFGMGHASVASAGRTHIAQFSRAAALRAGQVEAHRAGHLTDMAGALTLRTGDLACARGPRAMAGSTGFVARDVHARLRAADRLPEIDGHPIFQVSAFFGFLVLALAAAEELAENVAKTAAGLGAAPAARSGVTGKIGEIEAAEIELLPLWAAL